MDQFKLSESLKTLYTLIWDDFCSWYLEWIKPGFEKPMDQRHIEKAISYFEILLERLHPFMPFVTEEMFHLMRDQQIDICIKQIDLAYTSQTLDSKKLADGEVLKEAITAIRDARIKSQIKNKEAINIYCNAKDPLQWNSISELLCKQVNAERFEFTKEVISDSIQMVIGGDKFFITSDQAIDTSSQRKQLEEDLNYYKGFLASVEKKLSNEKFVQNAKPEVVEMEKKKQSDALEKIALLEESLKNLG
jgi:valyl-tRNA synthetase